MKLANVFKMGGTVEGNTLVGSAACMGNLDRGADVLFPGVGMWKGCLKEFLGSTGFVPDTHDWTVDAMLAMPTKGKENGPCLDCEAEFHSTQRAQDAKTIVSERLAKGMSIGLSVGFSLAPDGYAYFDDGEALLAMAEQMHCPMDLFDAKAIKAYRGYGLRGIWKAGDLFEFSICPVPMNRGATATAIKGLDFGESLGKSEFDERLALLLAVVREAGVRVESAANSDKISPHTADHLIAIIGGLQRLAGRITPHSAADDQGQDELLKLQGQVAVFEEELQTLAS